VNNEAAALDPIQIPVGRDRLGGPGCVLVIEHVGIKPIAKAQLKYHS